MKKNKLSTKSENKQNWKFSALIRDTWRAGLIFYILLKLNKLYVIEICYIMNYFDDFLKKNLSH